MLLSVCVILWFARRREKLATGFWFSRDARSSSVAENLVRQVGRRHRQQRHRLSSRWTRTRTSVSWKAKLARATTNLPVRQHSRFLVDQICVVGNVGQRRVADENADANNDDDNEDQGAANARANVPVALRHLLVRVAVVLCLISLCHARVNIAEK
jgi:hypothetical protein